MNSDLTRALPGRPFPSAIPGMELRAFPEAAVEADYFRSARLLYYLGFLFLGVLVLRPTAGFTLSDTFFLASLGLAFAALVARDGATAGYLHPAIALGGLLYGIGALASSLFSEPSFGAIEVFVRFFFLTCVWLWLGTIVLSTRQHVQTAMFCWAASTAACGGAALLQLFFGDVIPGSSPRWGRMEGFTTHPNDLGGICAVAAVAIAGVLLFTHHKREKLILTAFFVLTMAGLVLSGSVGAFVSAAAAFAVFVLMKRMGGRAIAGMALIALAGLSITVFQQERGGQTPLDRIQTVSSDEGSWSSRIDGYGNAMKRIADNPLLGVGPNPGGTFTTGVKSTQVHNVILASWYEAGLLGLAGITVVAVTLLTLGSSLSKNPSTTAYGTALLCSLIAFFIFAMSQPTLYVRYGWAPAALLLALFWIARQEGEAEEATSIHPAPIQPQRS